jgi:histidine ammonia-lyase
VEINSATDNPLVFPAEERSSASREVLSGGNFHAQIVAQALDLLAIAVADVASMCERRIERLINPDLSLGLPAFLARRPGLESGLMVVQVVVADILSEMRVLAHPASVDSVPTSASQEDHVSMGLAAARKARRAVSCLERILAAELLCAAQGIDYRRPLRSSDGVEEVHALVRTRVATLAGDRSLTADLETLADLVASGAVAAITRSAGGSS